MNAANSGCMSCTYPNMFINQTPRFEKRMPKKKGKKKKGGKKY